MLNGLDSTIIANSGGGRQTWLDGLKGLLCFQVFLGHFYIAFVCEDIIKTPSLFNSIFFSINTGYITVSLFCVISGYLLERKQIIKGYKLGFAIISRFLRFEIPLFPVFFAIMFLVRKTNIFEYSNLLAEFLSNKRLENHYPSVAHFTYLYRKPFYSLNEYINPLWMIKSLFYAGVFIYIKNYIIHIINKFKPKFSLIIEIFLYIFLFFIFRKEYSGVSVIFGSLICRLLSTKIVTDKFLCKPVVIISLIGLLVIFVCLHFYMYVSCNIKGYALPDYFIIEGMLLSWFVFIYLVTTKMKNIFDCKVFQFLGRNSFGIYVLHDFVIGVFSCVAIYYLKDLIGYRTSVLLVFPFTILFVFLCGFIFSVWEKVSTKYIKTVINFLEEN